MREIPTLPADKTTRSARLSAIPVMPFPPPLGVVASHRISRLVTESALLSRVPYSPGLPSPQPNRPNFTSPGEKTNLTQKGYITPSPSP